jgi:hypothetical protein
MSRSSLVSSIAAALLVLGLHTATANTVFDNDDGIIDPNQFSIIETQTPSGGRFTFRNNSSGTYFIEDVYITHLAGAHSPSTTDPEWTTFSFNSTFEYFVNVPGSRGTTGIGPGESSDLFFYVGAFGQPSSFEMYVEDRARNNLIGIAGVTLAAEVAAVPIPAALPLFASGLGLMGLMAWRRKKRLQD